MNKCKRKRVEKMTNFGILFYPETRTCKIWDVTRHTTLDEILNEIYDLIEQGGGGGGGINSINAGTGIVVDSSTPTRPTVSIDPNYLDLIELGGTAVQPEDLADVATSGDYNDLINLPDIPLGTVTSVAILGTDGILVDSGSPITESGTIQLGLSDDVLNQLADASTAVLPDDLSDVATSGDYNDLINKPETGNIIAGENITLTGSGLNRLWGTEDLTINATTGAAATRLVDLLDTGIENPISGDVLSYDPDRNLWVNENISTLIESVVDHAMTINYILGVLNMTESNPDLLNFDPLDRSTWPDVRVIRRSLLKNVFYDYTVPVGSTQNEFIIPIMDIYFDQSIYDPREYEVILYCENSASVGRVFVHMEGWEGTTNESTDYILTSMYANPPGQESTSSSVYRTETATFDLIPDGIDGTNETINSVIRIHDRNYYRKRFDARTTILYYTPAGEKALQTHDQRGFKTAYYGGVLNWGTIRYLRIVSENPFPSGTHLIGYELVRDMGRDYAG